MSVQGLVVFTARPEGCYPSKLFCNTGNTHMTCTHNHPTGSLPPNTKLDPLLLHQMCEFVSVCMSLCISSR
uniref:Uncharacterized protein n=1 Tax=Anguilla anguilla TaxID=7936 RepID=A0A0E9QAW2_ANGAN